MKLLVACLLSLWSFLPFRSGLSKPLIWNIERIDSIKSDTLQYKSTINRFYRIGDDYCNALPISVTDKSLDFLPDNHYYYQTSGYWWLDEDIDSFVYRDGYRNPDSKEYDLYRLKELSRRCRFLSISFYLSGDIKYYNAYIKQLETWFIDERTFMYPSFKYAGVVPDNDHEEKGVRGLAHTYLFIDIIESIQLVNLKKEIESKTYKAIQDWFRLFIISLEMDYGKSIDKVKNNISSGFDITKVYFYLFIGKNRKAKRIADQFADKWLYKQVKENGEQPAELSREAAYSYSLYNFTHILDFCFIYKHWNKDFYHENQTRIDSAFSFLEHYAKNPQLFPYSQVSDWEECISSFNRQKDRFDRLRGSERSLSAIGKKTLTISEVIE